MPEILATRCGSIASSKQAWMIAAVIEFVPAAGAQRRHRALVVAVGVAERVLRQLGMVEFRLGEIGHDVTFIGFTVSLSRWSPIALAMKRAVIGVPS